MTRKTQNTDKQKKPDKTATVADSEQKKPFNPWTATEKEALWEENATGRKGYHPYFDWCAAQRIKELRPKIEKAKRILCEKKTATGEGVALAAETGFDILNSLAIIFRKRLYIPVWLSDAFLQRVSPVVAGEISTWDDENSFGKPRTIAQAKEFKVREQIKLHVRHFIGRLRKENPGIKICPKEKKTGLMWLLMNEVNALNRENNLPECSFGTIKKMYYEVTNKYPERYSTLIDSKLRGRRSL